MYKEANRIKEYAESHLEELTGLIKALCAIPAPSYHEEKRAEFCKEWLERYGAQRVYIDEAKNMVFPLKDTGGEAVLFMAHSDTVFPDLEPMQVRVQDRKWFCPGIGDNTVNVANLLMMARYMLEHKVEPKCDIIFAINSCEEGLGNLKGCRSLFEKYGSRVKEVISLDLGFDTMFVKAVGSARYKVKIRTVGGHSWNDFGQANAICEAALLIKELYGQELPVEKESRTTYNVGLISGGTSVNTIAQYAEFSYEYRSDSATCMAQMQDNFMQILDAFKTRGTEVEIEELGVRPGMGECCDIQLQEQLFDRAENAIKAVTGKAPKRLSGSTDCNIPFSKGIPTVCFGLATMGGTHTREEYIEMDSIPLGLQIALNFLSEYFD